MMNDNNVFLGRRAPRALAQRVASIGLNRTNKVRGEAAPYDMGETMRKRALARTRALESRPWNGHVELTDECMMGLGLFEIANSEYTRVPVPIKLKETMVNRGVRVYSMGNTWGCTKVNLMRRSRDVTISDTMMQRLGDLSLAKYISEYVLISQLIRKMSGDVAVQNRWIPKFSPPLSMINEIINRDISDRLSGISFEIRGFTLAKPKTLGQWFLTLLNERIRRGVSAGVGLRTLIYCVCWCARLIQDHDDMRLEQSVAMIKTWLLQDSCSDCVYKFLRELREEYAFEYVFNVADSFSEQIKLPDIKPSIHIMPCGESSLQTIPLQKGFLRTMGKHSFLTSPYARTSLQVEIRVLPCTDMKKFFMTGKQTTSLRIALDMHARILRADEWAQSARVFMSCLSERRANDGATAIIALSQIIEDLVAIRRTSPEMQTTTAHLATLLFYGRMNSELLSAYLQDKRGSHEGGAHGFIVRYSFLRAPTPDVQRLADDLYTSFEKADTEGRRELFKINMNPQTSDHAYEIMENDLDLAKKWGVEFREKSDVLDELLQEGLAFFGGASGNAINDVEPSQGSIAASSSQIRDEDLEMLMEVRALETGLADSSMMTYRTTRSLASTTSEDTSSVIEPDDESIGYAEPRNEDDMN